MLPSSDGYFFPLFFYFWCVATPVPMTLDHTEPEDVGETQSNFS